MKLKQVALMALLTTTIVHADETPTYRMDTNVGMIDLKVQVSGGCKLNKTFNNARFGLVINELTENAYPGALSENGELLFLNTTTTVLSNSVQSQSINTNSGRDITTYKQTAISELDKAAINSILRMACPTQFELSPVVTRNAFTEQLTATFGSISYDVSQPYESDSQFKARIETWVLNPAKQTHKTATQGQTSTTISKTKFDKTVITIAFRLAQKAD